MESVVDGRFVSLLSWWWVSHSVESVVTLLVSLFFFFFSYSFLQSFQSFLCVFSMAKKSFLFLMFFYISHFFLSFFIKERGNKKWLPVCWVTCDMSYSEKFIS